MNYLIDFTASATQTNIEEYLGNYSCSVVKIFDNFDKVYLVSCALVPPSTSITESIIKDDDNAIQLLGEVIPTNTYNYVFDPTKPVISVSTNNEHDWWKNYILYEPNLDGAETTVSRKGELANVYIMDSGIDVSHPEFINTSITNLYSLTGEFQDTTGHGTALASVIAGNTCGMSSANLQIVKIFDNTQPTKQSDLLSAFDAILNDMLQKPTMVGVVNCSWSITKNIYIEQKIQALINAGLYVVASAGNNGLPISDVTPASMTDVITIGSFNKNFYPSDFSNYTDPLITSLTQNQTNSGSLDGWAPGENIWVAAPGGGYGYTAGTSIAAAIHSMACAYNMSDFVTANGTPSSYQRDVDFNPLPASLGHTGILNLVDEKYSTSVNKTSTLLNNFQRLNQVYPNTFEFAVQAGILLHTPIFEVHNTVSVEVMGNLPDGLQILSSGRLHGVPSEIIEDRKVFEATLKITYVDGTAVNRVAKITVLHQSFDTNNLTPDDPPLLISLLCINCSTAGNNSCCYDTSKTASCVSCSCFTADSMVLMADGTYKAISTIKVGESVASVNGNVTVVGIDLPVLGDRPLVSFDNDKCKTSYEHAIWSKDETDKEWWATRGMPQWLFEAANGSGPNFDGVLPFDLSSTFDEAWNFAHIDGWKKHTTKVIQANKETQLYHLLVDGVQSYFVDGYLVSSMSNNSNFDWSNLKWAGKDKNEMG